MSEPLAAEIRDLLARTATATLSAQLQKRGYTTSTVEGVHPLEPGPRMVGVARTLRLLPVRPDLAAERGGGFNAHKRVFDSLATGEVVMIDARGVADAGTLGDVMATRAKALGAAGIVTDGCVRDAEAVAALGIPTFSAGPHPALIGRRHVPWEIDVAIACGGATVCPGDVIIGDGDGVVVIPRALAEEIARDAVEQETEETFIAEMVKAGESLDGLYPMNADWRTRFETWRTDAGTET